MSLVKANGAGDQDTGFYNGVATQSLRFDDDSNSYLSKTLSGSSGNQKTWTYSFWFKHGSRTSLFDFLTANSSGDKFFEFTMTSAQKLTFYYHDSTLLVTSMQLRDRSAWYHIAVVHDTTQDDAGDRLKIYVNGVKVTDYDTNILNNTNLPEDFDGGVNETGVEHLIGRNQVGNNDLDGYLSDVYLLDGTAVGDTSGVLNEYIEIKNGICIPKKYSGSYGTHGFHFEFKQTGTGTASSSTIGADTSGQTNHYTSNGLDAHDSNMPDSPENNFATLNSLIKPHDPLAYEEGNLLISRGTESSAYSFAMSNMAVKTGKWYAEWRPQGTIQIHNHMVGVCVVNVEDQSSGDPYLKDGQVNYVADGAGHVDSTGNAGTSFSGNNSYASGDIVGVALDLDSGTKTVKFYKNNTLVNTTNLSSHFDDEHIGFMTIFYRTNGGMWNYGQDSSFAGNSTAQGNTDANGIGDFYYAPPSGHLALCSSNLPEPTISPNQSTQAVDHFGTLTYSSDGNAVNIVSGGNDNNGNAIGGEIDFSPDWVWIKRRNNANNHQLFDTNRGQKVLQSNETDDESDYASFFEFLSSSNGFRLPATSANMNANGGTYVAWNWKANGGTTSSDSNGSITSTVQANTTAGFSIVTYTSNGGDHTVGHGLGVAPKMFWLKDRDDTGSWYVYNENNGANKYQKLDDSIQAITQTSVWQNTAPTSTVFSVGGSVLGLANNTKCLAYCFAETEGYSKIGSYEGNGDADGTFVFTGFRPAWILYKNADSSGDWELVDTVRNPNNDGSLVKLEPNNTGQDSARVMDILSNGFKFRTSSNSNTAHTYIYMAFAEAPFKYANGR